MPRWILCHREACRCEECGRLDAGEFWVLFVTAAEWTRCVCADCAENL